MLVLLAALCLIVAGSVGAVRAATELAERVVGAARRSSA